MIHNLKPNSYVNSCYFILLFLTIVFVPAYANGSIYTPDNGGFSKQTYESSEFKSFTQMAKKNGPIRAIIELKLNVKPEGTMGTASVKDQRERIQSTQESILSSLEKKDYSLKHRHRLSPLLTVELTHDGLEAIQNHPKIDQIHLDTLGKTILQESVPYVQGDSMHENGITGSDRMVAVLDEGIDTSHAAFDGRVIAEACFSSGDDDDASTGGDCPNGGSKQIGSPAGEPIKIKGSPSNHGSHVGGIAAGEATTVPANNLADGVAREANLASIMIFHKSSESGDTVARFWISDLIAGLEHVADTLAENHNVQAVNMSLGGSVQYENHCDSAPEQHIISTLRSQGIAPVVASGNEGRPDSINRPGCVSDAIPVGATGISGQESIASFSNQDTDQVDIVAPGVDILSAAPGNSSITLDGTSMAAPHVSGAFALLDAVSGKPLEILRDALVTTGETIPDNRLASPPNASYKSIRINDALQKLRLESDFKLSVDTPSVDEPIKFIDQSTDFGVDTPIQTWDWSFGDGSETDVQSPYHTYTKSGTFPVSLEVTAADGDTDLTERIVSVNAPPEVEFSFSPPSPDTGEVVNFNDTSVDPDGDIVKHSWDFGDSTTSDTTDPSNVYNDTGNFTVILEVTDSSGEAETATKSFTVGIPFERFKDDFVTSDTRPADTVAFFNLEPSDSTTFHQITVEDQVSTTKVTGNPANSVSDSCTDSNYQYSFSLSDTSSDQIKNCLWTNQERFALLYGTRSDTSSLTRSNLPKGIIPGSEELDMFNRTIFSLEFGDSTGTILGDTTTTTDIGDSFAYTLVYTLSETTTRLYHQAGFDTSTGSDDFRFYYADTYGGEWRMDDSVDVSVESIEDSSSVEITVSGLTKDLPGGLGGSNSFSSTAEFSSTSSSSCVIERTGLFNSLIESLRHTRDSLLQTSIGRLLTNLYYESQ